MTSKDYVLPVLLVAGVLTLVTSILTSVVLSLRNNEEKKTQYKNTLNALIVFAALTLLSCIVITVLNDEVY